MPWHILLSGLGIVLQRTWLEVENGRNEPRVLFSLGMLCFYSLVLTVSW